MATHPVPDQNGLAIGVPGHGMGAAEALDLVDAGFGPHVPHLEDAIAAQATQLGILDRVERHLLDAGEVALELGRIPCKRLLGVPWRASRGSWSDGRLDRDAGFQNSHTRRVLSVLPVATRLPRGFQAMERRLAWHGEICQTVALRWPAKLSTRGPGTHL